MALERRLYGSRRTGTVAWLWQRVTAIVIGLGLLALGAALALAGHLRYAVWQGVMASFPVRILLFLWLLAIVIHAYLGIETILKDYVHAPFVRLGMQAGALLVLLGLLAFGAMVFVTWR
ncbi:MAG: succinate dehydrogenase, hydrophobic membrane anchor protein [Gammaproteobacteria bacterium]|nr:succinate dehydrogenase, hydrophobic membrane anchor protein [Gammaproteobacteria bacterium]